MYELIVLGLIPGTNIQITFELFVTAMLAITVTSMSFWCVVHFHLLYRINLLVIAVGQNAKRSFVYWQNALPIKLQLFK